MEVAYIFALFLMGAKALCYYTGEEIWPLDYACAGIGGATWVISGILLLRYGGGKAKHELFFAEFLSPRLFVLGLIVLIASALSAGTSDEPYLVIEGELYAHRDYAWRLPGKEVFHYTNNPIHGELSFDTRVTRNDPTLDGEWRSILIKANTVITYDRGEHEQQRHFPELWEFNDVIRDAMVLAQGKMPSGLDPNTYEGGEFRRIFLEEFEELTLRKGRSSGRLHFDIKLKIVDVDAGLEEDFPKNERWAHAIFSGPPIVAESE